MENSPAILAIGHAILARGERKSDFSQISCRHTAAAAFSSLLEGNYIFHAIYIYILCLIEDSASFIYPVDSNCKCVKGNDESTELYRIALASLALTQVTLFLHDDFWVSCCS